MLKAFHFSISLWHSSNSTKWMKMCRMIDGIFIRSSKRGWFMFFPSLSPSFKVYSRTNDCNPSIIEYSDSQDRNLCYYFQDLDKTFYVTVRKWMVATDNVWWPKTFSFFSKLKMFRIKKKQNRPPAKLPQSLSLTLVTNYKLKQD